MTIRVIKSCSVYKVVKITYIVVSILIILLICSLLACEGDFDEYIRFLPDSCATAIQLTIASLVFVNLMLLISYNVWNRCCRKRDDQDSIEGYVTIV